MGDLDIHTRAQHILHAELISAPMGKFAPERPMPYRGGEGSSGEICPSFGSSLRRPNHPGDDL